MPPRLKAIAERQLRDPERIMIAQEKTAAGKMPRVRQVAYVIPRAQKAAALQRVLDMESPTSAIVFCRTRLEVDSLVETLNAHGYRAEALHGGMQQRQREAVMAASAPRRRTCSIATDVAARGLDIQQLSHVFNYDVPTEPDAYVHRIGRTGRAGREGTAITLAEPREHRLLRSIEHVVKQRIEIASVPTIADLRARRLELTRASLRARLVEGDLDDVRVVVESLANEFDIVDIAAAAVKLAHDALTGDTEDQDVAIEPVWREPESRRGGPAGPREGRPSRPRTSRNEDQAVTRLFIGAGRRAGVRPERSRRRDYQRGEHLVEGSRRHRNCRHVLAGGSAHRAGRRRRRGHAQDDASRPEGRGAARPGCRRRR